MMKRVLVLVVFVSGCASIEPQVPPQPLTEFTPAFRVKEIWSRSAATDTGNRHLGLTPATDGLRVYAASYAGDIRAYELQTGKKVWDIELEHQDNDGWFSWGEDFKITAGPAVAEGTLAVGTGKGEVVTLRSDDGTEIWRAAVSSAVLAPPAIGGGYVVVRTIDEAVTALSAADGHELWTYEQSQPALTLRGTSAPVIAGGRVYAGFDNGKLAALELATGRQLWEVPIATPTGRTELERLVDLDGVFKVTGQEVHVTAYHGTVALVSATGGQALWSQEQSSYKGLEADRNAVYVTTEASEIWAYDKRTGNVLWNQDQLRGRWLTAPVRFGGYLVVGDFEGYLHFLSADTGVLLARAEHDNSAIVEPPVPINDILLVLSEGGVLAAYRIIE